MKNILSFKYFDELYLLFVLFISILGWLFSSISGMVFLLLLGSTMLIVSKSFKYTFPCLINLFFIQNDPYVFDKVPIPIIVIASIFLFLVIAFTIYRMIKDKKVELSHHTIGFIMLSLIVFIPIFWSPNKTFLNAIYFSGFGYLLIYLVFKYSLDVDRRFFGRTLSFLGALIAVECVVKAISVTMDGNNIFSSWYTLGWGICNEAGIMICVILPFTFYNLFKSKKKRLWIDCSLLIILGIGFLFTGSRGTYIFGGIEIIALFVMGLFVMKRKKVFYFMGGSFLLVVLILSIVNFGFIVGVFSGTFNNGLDNNGRFELYKEAGNIFSANYRNMFFGSGFLTQMDWQNRIVVYHSTICETMVVGGIFGIIALLYHLFYKYRDFKRLDFEYLIFMCIGFICVDLYGLIDNTYFMYYYMIILAIIIGFLENEAKKRIEINNIM